MKGYQEVLEKLGIKPHDLEVNGTTIDKLFDPWACYDEVRPFSAKQDITFDDGCLGEEAIGVAPSQEVNALRVKGELSGKRFDASLQFIGGIVSGVEENIFYRNRKVSGIEEYFTTKVL